MCKEKGKSKRKGKGKSKRKGKGKGKRKGKEKGKSKDTSKEETSDTSNTKCSLCKGNDCLKWRTWPGEKKTMSHELSELTMIDSDASVHVCLLKKRPRGRLSQIETIARSRNATARNETDELRQ